MNNSDGNLAMPLASNGVSRRDFLKFCSIMAGTLALPSSFVPTIAHALQTAKKPTVVWLEYRDCAGCTESLLRANNPTIANIVLDILSVDYHETIMAPAGKQAEKSLEDAIAPGGHILVVEGAIPDAEDGIYCTIGGKTALSSLEKASQNAAAVIAVGNCACFGGIPAAALNILGRVDPAVTIIELVTLVAFLVGLGASRAVITTGILELLFWVGAVVIGVLVPLGLGLMASVRGKEGGYEALLAALWSIIGGLVLRAVIVLGGQVYG